MVTQFDPETVTAGQLAQWLDAVTSIPIAVIGDYVLDQYWRCDPRLAEPSLETGLTAHRVVDIRRAPGAAGTVVNNLVALGARQVFAVGAIGDDGHGFELRQELARLGVCTTYLVSSADRITPTYTKPTTVDPACASDPAQDRENERFDWFNTAPTPVVLEEQLHDAMADALAACRGAMVLDQFVDPRFGSLTPALRAYLGRWAASHPDQPVLADSRYSIANFVGVIVKANREEALRATGQSESVSTADLTLALAKRAGGKAIVTENRHGAFATDNGQVTHVPAISVDGPVDPTGAGDSFSAGFLLGRLAGASFAEAIWIGNLVASITVTQLNTTGTARPAEVLARHAEVLCRRQWQYA